MSTRKGLADLLFGRTRGAILALLYGHADQSFYTRQMAREVNASVGAVQRELENLSKVGLIVRKSVGSQVFYQANRGAPLFREMQALVNKTIGVFSILRSAMQSLSKQIVVAFVYGSVAREEETSQSDVDLMVIGRATLDEVLSRLSTVEKSIGRPINPTVYSVAEFKSKLASGNHFLTAVLKGQKVFLLGDEDELRKVGGVRLAKAGADQPPGRSKIFWELWNAASPIQRSKSSRPICDLSLLTRLASARVSRAEPDISRDCGSGDITTECSSGLR